jgi:hypothetical protein
MNLPSDPLDALGKLRERQAIEEQVDIGEPAVRPANEARPTIEITADEAAVVDQAELAIARFGGIYQRGAQLVHVRRDLASPKFLNRPAGTPEIAPLSKATCRETLSRAADFVRYDGRIQEWKPTRPPNWVAEDLLARGQWEHVRPLRAVVETPVLRPDGTVLAKHGYDASTGILLEPFGEIPTIPDFPTRDDALAACEHLLDIVTDFPFVSEAHRSAWLAAQLVSFARQSILGRIPLVFFEAPTAGTGKTLLADTIGVLWTGRELAKMANTLDDNEMRKRLLAIGLAGDPIVLIDNVRGGFGTPSLDMTLTAGFLKDRVLGLSEERSVPVDTIFLASGNNVELLGDTRRRVLHCRINARVERPEERDGFRHPDLLAWIARERPQLIVAALTILRAFCLAGRPVVGRFKPWGSFEAYQALICGAIRWLGLPAPEDTRLGLIEGETETERLGSLLRAWDQAQPDEGMTAAEALRKSEAESGEALREAIAAVARKGRNEATPESLGYYLRRMRERVVDGRFFTNGMATGNRRWFVASPSADGGDGAHRQTSIEKLAGRAEMESFDSSVQTSPPSVRSAGCPCGSVAHLDFDDGVRICGRCGAEVR